MKLLEAARRERLKSRNERPSTGSVEAAARRLTMFTLLKKAFGGRTAAKVTAKQVRLELEALDQRVVPSSIPNLQGVTLALDGPNAVHGRALQIASETDRGNGTGTFQGVCYDAHGYAPVSGTISFAHGNGSMFNPYDFKVNYSGVGASYFGGPDWITGSGDFTCTSVSSDHDAYSQYSIGLGTNWAYSGSDTEVYGVWGAYGQLYFYGSSHYDYDYQVYLLH
jgi:hypothetical protein